MIRVWRWLRSLSGACELSECLVVMVGMALLMSSPSLGEEIPAGPNVPVMKEIERKNLAFQRRIIVDSYRNSGVRNELWDAKVLAFLEIAALQSSDPWCDVSDAELVLLGHEINKLGCDDPLFRYQWSRFLSNTRDVLTTRWTQNSSFPGLLSRPGYPAMVRVWAARRMWAGAQDVRKKKYYLDVMNAALSQALRSGVYRKDERDVLLFHLEDLIPRASGKDGDSLLEAILSTPKLDPVVREFAIGRRHLAQAWENNRSRWRGRWAERREWIRKHLGLAAKHLTAAWKLDPKSPYAAAAMIDVINGSRVWFDRAVAARFDYNMAYWRMSRSFCSGRGGNHKAIYAFGLEFAATERYDTFVPYQLVQNLLMLAKPRRMDFSFMRGTQAYENAKMVLTRYIHTVRWAKRQNYYRSVLLCLAFKTGHLDDARQMLAMLKGVIDPAARSEFRISSSTDIAGIVRTHTGPGGPSLRKANALMAKGDNLEARKLYARAMELSKDPLARAYIQRIQEPIPEAIPVSRPEGIRKYDFIAVGTVVRFEDGVGEVAISKVIKGVPPKRNILVRDSLAPRNIRNDGPFRLDVGTTRIFFLKIEHGEYRVDRGFGFSGLRIDYNEQARPVEIVRVLHELSQTEDVKKQQAIMADMWGKESDLTKRMFLGKVAFWKSEAIVPFLMRALASKDPYMKRRAVKLITRHKFKQTIPFLIKRLRKDKDPIAAETLGKLKATEAFDALVEAVKDDKFTTMRYKAVWALWKLGDKRAISLFVQCINRHMAAIKAHKACYPYEADYAVKALGAMKAKEGIKPLIGLLKKESMSLPDLLEATLDALEAYGPAAKEALSALEMIARDDSHVFSKKASKLVAKLNPPKRPHNLKK